MWPQSNGDQLGTESRDLTAPVTVPDPSVSHPPWCPESSWTSYLARLRLLQVLGKPELVLYILARSYTFFHSCLWLFCHLSYFSPSPSPPHPPTPHLPALTLFCNSGQSISSRILSILLNLLFAQKKGTNQQTISNRRL